MLEGYQKMNASEGIRRLGAVIRWIGDGLGILCVVIGFANVKAGDSWWPFGLGLIIGAFVFGVGRAISWIIQGFAKND